jgi:hypothetical protein
LPDIWSSIRSIPYSSRPSTGSSNTATANTAKHPSDRQHEAGFPLTPGPAASSCEGLVTTTHTSARPVAVSLLALVTAHDTRNPVA